MTCINGIYSAQKQREQSRPFCVAGEWYRKVSERSNI